MSSKQQNSVEKIQGSQWCTGTVKTGVASTKKDTTLAEWMGFG